MSQHEPTPQQPRPPERYEREPSVEREGLEEWFASGQDDTAALCDPNAGVPIRWVEGVGWVTE
jgi:hypothetical protein